MDPDKLLEELLEESKNLMIAFEQGKHIQPIDMFQIAAGLMYLDEWIREGGFLPARWRKS